MAWKCFCNLVAVHINNTGILLYLTYRDAASVGLRITKKSGWLSQDLPGHQISQVVKCVAAQGMELCFCLKKFSLARWMEEGWLLRQAPGPRRPDTRRFLSRSCGREA